MAKPQDAKVVTRESPALSNALASPPQRKTAKRICPTPSPGGFAGRPTLSQTFYAQTRCATRKYYCVYRYNLRVKA